MLIEPFAQGNILYKPMHNFYFFFFHVVDALFLFHMLKKSLSSMQQYCTSLLFTISFCHRYCISSDVLMDGHLTARCRRWCCVGTELEVVCIKCRCYASNCICR